MSKIDIDTLALREAAERAIPAMERLLMLPVDDDLISEQELKDYGVDIDALNAFKFLAGPETVLALLDEIEAKDRRITELEAREVQLPTRYDLRYGHPINADKRHVMIPKENGSWLCLIDLEHALRVAGIRIKGE
ncbi:TPA: ead/Ea22-like family protein [Escherichia coli]|uniref:ead/Ea22-like family protein n=1 Tax=Escherichia TaxID=561 RepID=UPI000F0BBB04|nr:MULTISPECIES: ead/Ea22-like family protein [Escherichia]EFC5429065.1 ead/Ea22-like family protein [Escherichia coli]EFE6983058.1 ead/Ea22-like family protein [Escherichia coli]EHP0910254.1 ead/Ea22-like family protein [Escherichia coli]EIH3781949.1 ead/Ea22-like family protein [Escherichia coli]EJW6184834.1 ead/Ea22-like family protein [Escherichia coli]